MAAPAAIHAARGDGRGSRGRHGRVVGVTWAREGRGGAGAVGSRARLLQLALTHRGLGEARSLGIADLGRESGRG